ncbi:hypothetical protein KSC_012750 [Ktedonobacter sp. SOSP1-52]|nr:hypothetical protein KSC_012750 [Ktedonobacter sp. SOSP1-52]
MTFTLEEVAEGTRLTLVESGFASLPGAFQTQSHQDNQGGWQSELPKLRVYPESTISAT